MNPGSKTDIEICLGPECREHGGVELSALLQQCGITTERGHCRGLCIYAPVVHLNNRCIPDATREKVVAGISETITTASK